MASSYRQTSPTKSRFAVSSSDPRSPLQQLPLSCTAENDNERQTVSSTKSISRKWCCLVIMILLFPWGMYIRTNLKLASLGDETARLQTAKQKSRIQLTSTLELTKTTKSNKMELEKSTASLTLDLRKSGVLTDVHAKRYDELEAKEEILLKLIDEMESHVEDNCRFAIEQTYGAGPHRVELILRSKSHMRIRTQTIMFELASVDVMPHTTHFFLRMLKENLWPGMSFMSHRDSPHRIQASPIEVETLESKEWRFDNANVKSLAFAEQSPAFPCGPYSVGFHGNPGGPDFYLNGRYVPTQFAANSCFASIVSGTDIVDSILDKKESAVLGIESIRLV